MINYYANDNLKDEDLKEYRKKNKKQIIRKKVNCIRCGKEFEQYRKNHKFCSKRCYLFKKCKCGKEITIYSKKCKDCFKAKRHGSKFSNNEKSRIKWEKLTIEEKREKMKNRVKKANKKCLDCGCLIFPKARRCKSCNTKKRHKEFFKNSLNNEKTNKEDKEQ